MKKLLITEEDKERILSLHLQEQQTFDFKTAGKVKNSGDENWSTKYACVTKQPGVTSQVFGGNTSYTVKNIIYYNNGTKQINGKLYNYNCETEFKTINSSSSTAQPKQPVVNPNNPIELKGVTINTKPQVKTNPVLQQTMTINKQIQQKLGIKQTGKLTHNELEVLIKTLTPNATPTQQ
jgi:hypothetical protein